MKTLVSSCKLEFDVLAKFTIRQKSQSEQNKAITLRNVIYGSVLMACTFLLSKYQFFTFAWITQHLIITGDQPKAGTGLKMQMVRFFNVT